MKQVVRCLLKNEKNKFLFVKHTQATYWTLPGWHIEEWETLYEALEREIKEEFNFDIEILGWKIGFSRKKINELPLPISCYEIEYTSKKWGELKKMEYIFLAKIIWWKLKIQEEEIDDYRYFSKKEILELDNTFWQIKEMIQSLD